MAPPSPYADHDVPAWGVSHDDNFLVKSAYLQFTNLVNAPHKALFHLIWRWGGMEIHVFLWQLATSSSMTNVFRWSRHFTLDPCCSRCNEGLHETMLIRDYFV